MGDQRSPTVTEHKLEDLSGITLKPGENPYATFIAACNDEPDEIQLLYHIHRNKRNSQQKDKFLSRDYKQLTIDQHLLRLECPEVEPGFTDERNCLVFWARPPIHILRLTEKLQAMLKRAAPNVWLMPTYRMHLTVLEVAFEKTPKEIEDLVSTLRPSLPAIVSHTFTHRARLVKPMISHDLSAFAVSFLPAAGEQYLSPASQAADGDQPIVREDSYTYHHLRRDIFDKVKEAGVAIGSRYQVPSAHITLGRFLSDEDHNAPEKRRRWIEAIDEINNWLENQVWDMQDAEYTGEWIVGQEKGLDARNGTLWYGGGRTISMGEGF